MSIEQFKAFMEAVKADAGLQEKLKAASDAYAVVAIANGAGFVISIEEFKGARSQAEISEELLDFVVGGYINMTPQQPFRPQTSGRQLNCEDPFFP